MASYIHIHLYYENKDYFINFLLHDYDFIQVYLLRTNVKITYEI